MARAPTRLRVWPAERLLAGLYRCEHVGVDDGQLGGRDGLPLISGIGPRYALAGIRVLDHSNSVPN